MVGFIGLGIMGKPMAKNLLAAGVELMVYDINTEAMKQLEEAGAISGSLQEMGEKCTVIFTILPNGSIVKQVLFDNGISSTIKPGSIVCDMSSVTPLESQFCSEELKKQKVGFVDAPVSGGEPGAIQGTLAFMVGGEEEDFEALKPYFEIMGSSAVLIGDSGSGSVTKLVNQVIVNLNIAVVSEAFVFAQKAGVDVKKVYEAIRGGLAGSVVLDSKIPMIMERNFKPGGKISINHKDITNVMDAAHNIGVPMPMTCQLMEIFQILKGKGYMGEDHCGIVHYFEELADVQITSKNRYER